MNTRFAVAAMLIGVLSCSDSGPSAPGTMSFTYVLNGVTLSFTATGNIPLNEANVAWAAGAMQTPPQQGAMAFAFRPQSDSTSDIMVVSSERTSAGSAPIVAAECDSISCTSMGGIFANGDICALTSGTVNLSEASSSRLKGTFSGAGICTDFFASDTTSFSVSNGTFDVPVIEGFGGQSAMPASGRIRVRPIDAAMQVRRRSMVPFRP